MPETINTSSSNNLELTQDPTSVYFLHPSDNTSVQLVSPTFDGTGYADWKRMMIISLSAKNKTCFVDGSLDKPTEVKTLKAWQRCNNMVTGWILRSLDAMTAKSVLHLMTAREIWKDLEERFGQSSTAQLYSIQQDLATISQENDDVGVFFTKMKVLWDELDNSNPLPCCECTGCTCNLTQKFLKIQQDQRLVQFLMKLKEGYQQVRTNILMMPQLPPLSQAYRLVLQEQRHKELSSLHTSSSEPMAFAADRQNFSMNRNNYKQPNFSNSGFHSSKPPYSSGNKPVIGNKRGSYYYCSHCKIPGHSLERCFKVHGYPADYKPPQKRFAAAIQGEDLTDDLPSSSSEVIQPVLTMDQYQKLLDMLGQSGTQKQDLSKEPGDGKTNVCFASKFCLTTQYKSGWVLDSGATDHICHDLSLFHSYKVIDNPDNTITVPDGRKIQITHIGTIILNDIITLSQVLYVPGFHFNLISVPKLCHDFSGIVTFSANQCTLQGPSLTRPLALGKLYSGLYYVQDPSSTSDDIAAVAPDAAVINTCETSQPGFMTCIPTSLTSSYTVDDIELWHLRLGHMPFSQMVVLFPEFNFKLVSDSLCQICPKARQTRLTFHSSISTTCKPFQLIHVDTWGPYVHPTNNGCRFFLTLVDDYTRTTWVHLIKFKSDAVDIIINFAAYVKTQFQSTIQTIRTDNAKELCEGSILQFYTTNGIIHQRSCADSPQQNGIVERKHRHLLETARALFFQAKLPFHLWGECVLCAAYLINRMPLSSLNKFSPHQKLYGVVPDKSHFRSFGCLCFASTLKSGISKFDSRADTCVFLGYPPNQKAYKLYHLAT